MTRAVTARALTRWLLVAAAAAFAVVNVFNALHKGGDFSVYLDAGLRLIRGSPLYEASGIAGGVIGPPFQPVLLVPFAALALLNVEAARLVWYGFNLVCLAAGLYWWHVALAPARGDVASRPGLIVWPLLAVGYPLQTNFEHQNINAVLLALIGLAALLDRQGRSRSAGLWLGAAAALKVFPLLLFGVLAVRRRWRTLAWATASAVALTLVPVVRYGVAGYATLLRDWWSLSGSGQWPIRRHNQSLFAMLGRYLEPGDLLTWGPIPDTASPHVHLVWIVAALLLTVILLAAIARPPAGDTTVALTAGLCLAVVLSPIAWEHYWLLLWPAFAISYSPPAGAPRWVVPAFWVSAVLTSAIAPSTVGRAGTALARGLSVRTWAALLLCVAVLAVYRALQRAALQRLSCVHHEHSA